MNPILTAKNNIPESQKYIQQYEILRSYVLDNSNKNITPNMGYVLFLRQGMLIWMQNCISNDDSEIIDNSDVDECTDIPDSSKNKLIHMLCEIIINRQRRIYG